MTFHRPLLLVFLACCLVPTGFAQQAVVDDVAIPEEDIVELREDLFDARETSSKTAQRRGCKNVIRAANSLLEEYTGAINQYEVMQLLFVGQQQLLMLDNSAANRKEFFETCESLMQAPDAYAKARLQADVLLTRRKLAAATVTDDQRVYAIADLADRYRNTEAEAESLMICSLYALEMTHDTLVDAFVKRLATHYGQEPAVIKFLREKMGFTSDSRFKGNFKRQDGTELNFTEGPMLVAVYWSKDMAFLKTRLAEIGDAQKRFPGQFEVYSFNVDGLADGGKKFLADMGYDFHVMRIDPRPLKLINILVVDEYGWSRGGAIGHGHHHHRASISTRVQRALGYPELSPILLALRVGDFLVTEIPADDITRSIHEACVPAPRRYELTAAQALDMYNKVEALCTDALKTHSDAKTRWKLLNHQIIANMGRWRLTRDAEFMKQAASAAHAVINSEASLEEQLPARYCLAIQDLHDNEPEAEALLDAFLKDYGEQASGRVHAAAFLLAFASQSRPLYNHTRDILLNRFHEDPATWTLSSLLMDPNAAAILFERAFGDEGKDKPRSAPAPATAIARRFDTSLLGAQFNPDTINTVVFTTLCEDRNAISLQENMFKAAQGVSHTVGVLPASDRAGFDALIKKHAWNVAPVYLESNKWERAARAWGVVATQKSPTVYVTKPDASILLAISGASNKRDSSITVEGVIRQYKLDLSDRSLFNGDYATYIKEVNASFPLKNAPRPRYSTSYEDRVCLHRLKQIWTYMQMKDWDKALASANENIDIHMKPPSNDYFKYCPGCARQVNCLAIRLNCLKELGQTEEAANTEAMLKAAVCPPGNPDINDRPWRMPGEPAARLKYMDDHMRIVKGRSGNEWQRKLTMIQTLMMRAQIFDALGKKAEAEKDRERARAQSWPHPPKEYDARTDILAAAYRRKVVKKEIEAENWLRALELINQNVTNHEAEAVRRKQHCADCSFHVVALKKREPFLKELGWDEALKTNQAMLKAMPCPAGTTEEAVAKFPIVYLHTKSKKGPKGKIEFIRDYMAGDLYSSSRESQLSRHSLGDDLALRARIYEALGEAEKAEQDRLRAMGVKFPHGLDDHADGEDGPKLYVDLLENKAKLDESED